MPTNNFKLFDENKANMMTDEEYAQNTQRLNGVQSGVASSQLQNKTLYQTALMCYALAQLMAANGYDANDANAVSTFVNNLSSSVLQKVVDKASANDIKNKVAGKWVDSSIFGQNMESLGETYLKLAGGTMTGNLILNSDPTQNLQAATKQYVDKKIKIVSYVGNDGYGINNPVNISLPSKPKIIFAPWYTRTDYPNEISSFDYNSPLFGDIIGESYKNYVSFISYNNTYMKYSNGILSIYGTSSSNQANYLNWTYHWAFLF